jgi:hypothetical protein
MEAEDHHRWKRMRPKNALEDDRVEEDIPVAVAVVVMTRQTAPEKKEASWIVVLELAVAPWAVVWVAVRSVAVLVAEGEPLLLQLLACLLICWPENTGTLTVWKHRIDSY